MSLPEQPGPWLAEASTKGRKSVDVLFLLPWVRDPSRFYMGLLWTKEGIGEGNRKPVPWPEVATYLRAFRWPPPGAVVTWARLSAGTATERNPALAPQAQGKRDPLDPWLHGPVGWVMGGGDAPADCALPEPAGPLFARGGAA